ERVELAAEIDGRAIAQGFVARVTTHGEAGETRELSAASCTELTAAVAVVVARAATTAPVAPPPPAPPPPPPPAVASLAVPVVAPPRHSRWNAGARLGGITGIGATPDLGIGGELALWGSLDDAGLELAVERWATTTANVGNGNGVSVDLIGTSLRGGWFPRARPVRAWLVGERGTQRGTGFGFAMPTHGEGGWSALGAGGAYTYRIAPHLAAVVAGEALAALERVTFVVDGATAYRSPGLALRAQLGLEIAWH
ncbi:MAG: hypothetical protein ABI678_32910, partial [Kofleriaceae bacterium]